MELLTLSDARDLLWEYAPAGPDGLKVELSSATTAQKAYWRGKLNQVIAVLLKATNSRGTQVVVPDIPIYDGVITMPRQFEALVGVNLSCGPRTIYSRFWPFTEAGHDFCCTNGVKPINDQAQTFIIPEDIFHLRVKTETEADEGKVISFYGGKDEDGDEIFTTTTLTLALDTGGGFAGSESIYAGSVLLYAGAEGGTEAPTTDQLYTKLPRISKVTTVGPVFIYSVDSETEEETLIAVYGPNEKNPSYKQYEIANVGDDDTTAECLCSLAYVPVVDDTDIIVPGVLSALKLGLRALTYEDNGDERAESEWERSKRRLDEDRQGIDGTFQPTFQFAPDFGAGGIVNVM